MHPTQLKCARFNVYAGLEVHSHSITQGKVVPLYTCMFISMFS